VRIHAPWETDWKAGRAEAVRWMRYRKAPRLPDGRLDPLALLALTDTIPPAIGQRLGPGYPYFLAPSCDLTVHFLESTAADWLLLRTSVAHAGDGYASGSAEIWDPEGRLLARAAQLMYLRLGESDPRG
jgi:acyl-CoA thioesterase